MADHTVVLYEEDVPGAKLMKDPNDWSVEELKRWLQCHGFKNTVTKVELIERVRLSNGIVKIDLKIDGGKWYEYKRTGSVVQDSETDVLVPRDGWKRFPSCNTSSMFNYGHLYYYLVVETIENQCLSDYDNDNTNEDTESSVGDTVTAKPLKKGRNLLNSGFVGNVQDNSLPNGDYALRVHVHHSMKELLS